MENNKATILEHVGEFGNWEWYWVSKSMTPYEAIEEYLMDNYSEDKADMEIEGMEGNSTGYEVKDVVRAYVIDIT